MKKICVTGANGFIGRSICKILADSNKTVRGFVRNLNPSLNLNNIEYVPVGDMSLKINWKDFLGGVDCIIHCAGKTDSMNEKNEQDIFRSINVEGTKQLAEQAAKSGVKRLVFLSSIKVNGEGTYINYRNSNLNNQEKKNIAIAEEYTLCSVIYFSVYSKLSIIYSDEALFAGTGALLTGIG